MKAITIPTFGDAGVLTLTEQPDLNPADGEVLIKVHAAGVNRPDLLQREGKYPPPPGVTDIPGLEVAGEIVKSNSPEWQEGDKVCALLAGGGYAEYAVAPAGQCLPVPESLSMAEAAALPETVFTVWNNLFKRGKLQKDQTALIHGGASGIGTTAIQMAKAWGVKVIITAGSQDKCDACLKLGTDQAVNYKEQDFVEVIGENTVDVVLDMVGGDYVGRNMRVLKTDGHHVNIAALNGPKAEIHIMTLMQKRLIMTGSTLRPRSLAEKRELRDEIMKHIWPLVSEGKIKPVMFKSFALDHATDAHKALEKGDHVGKIVLLNA